MASPEPCKVHFGLSREPIFKLVVNTTRVDPLDPRVNRVRVFDDELDFAECSVLRHWNLGITSTCSKSSQEIGSHIPWDLAVTWDPDHVNELAAGAHRLEVCIDATDDWLSGRARFEPADQREAVRDDRSCAPIVTSTKPVCRFKNRDTFGAKRTADIACRKMRLMYRLTGDMVWPKVTGHSSSTVRIDRAISVDPEVHVRDAVERANGCVLLLMLGAGLVNVRNGVRDINNRVPRRLGVVGVRISRDRSQHSLDKVLTVRTPVRLLGSLFGFMLDDAMPGKRLVETQCSLIGYSRKLPVPGGQRANASFE